MEDKKYMLSQKLMPFPSYDTLCGALNSMALLLSGISSGALELTDDVIAEVREVLDFVMNVQMLSEQDRFSEFLNKDNERFKKQIKMACESEGVDYEEASQLVKASSEIGMEKFNQALDKAKKEKN